MSRRRKGEGGNIRETLIVMAAAYDSDLQTMILSANYSRLDVGFMRGRHNEKRFWGFIEHKSEVSVVRLEDIREGRILGRMVQNRSIDH